jgi:DNA-binding response OmpR family regulator
VASGYAVDQVGTGTEADAALASHEFDLLILDLGLPKHARLRGAAQAARARQQRCRC